MAVSRMSTVVFSSSWSCLLGRSQGVLQNNGSRIVMVGVPLGCRLKISPLSFGRGKPMRNVSTSVVRAGLDDSIINFDYLTKNMPMTTPLPPFDTMPGSAIPGSMPYERRTPPPPPPPPPPPAYDSPQHSKPYERSSVLDDGPIGSTPAERMSPPPAVEEGPKLYVGNLPWTCDSQQLAEIFQDCGTVELVEVIYDRETSRSRGFGFVTMASQAEASAAKLKLDGYILGGRSLTVSFPQSNRGDRPRPPPRREFGGGNGVGLGSYDSANKLFVGNLSWGVDDASLQNMFSKYGTVVDARVVYDRETGRSRGFGFVTLSNSDEVNEAIQNMDGADFDGRQIRVNVAGDKPPPRREY